MSFNETISDTVTNYIQSIDQALGQDPGAKTNTLLSLKKNILSYFTDVSKSKGDRGAVVFVATMVGGIAIASIFSTFMAGLPILIPGLLLSIHLGHQDEIARRSKEILVKKIDHEIRQQIDAEGPPATALDALKAASLKEQFQSAADAAERFEELRQKAAMKKIATYTLR